MSPRAPLPRRAHLGLELSLGVRPTLPGPRLWVESVDPGSPAEQAGLCVGDALLSLAGTVPNDLDHVRALVARLPVNAATEVSVQRGERRLELRARAVPLPLEALGVGEVVLDEVPWREHRLRAVWTFPEPAGSAVPAIWMLPGAAWLSEEHPIEPRSARLELVRGFTRAGFATLRVERSGLGDSEGPPCTELDLHGELEGWRAAREHFCTHPRVLHAARFVYARSLGGMLAPLLCERSDFAALAVWGSSAQPWARGMLAASERQYRLSGRRGAGLERTLQRLAELSRLIYEQQLTPEAAYQRQPELRDTDPVSFVGHTVYGRTASFFQQLAATDVAAAWRGVTCPVLALHGSSDWLSLAADSEEIARLAPRGEYRELAGIDHMMHARTSVEEAFAEPWGGLFTPLALDALLSFFLRQL